MKKMFLMVGLTVGLFACAPAASESPKSDTQLVLMDEEGKAVKTLTVEQDGLEYRFEPVLFLYIGFKVSNHNPYPVQLLWNNSEISSSTMPSTSLYLEKYGTDLDQRSEPQILEGHTSTELKVAPRSQMQISEIKFNGPGFTGQPQKIVLPSPFLSETDPVTLKLVWNFQGAVRTHSFNLKQKIVRTTP
ncbi:hypothetical protein [Deinococcus cellulosilyticus]|uniref:Uncharacterized protein n=1 Tax=Deinococcus cellulosilyticus (strain DSM 18568 / NBRC 106333 / KACC 11606 / 5516J-15) TaxID=1223518 RepID=A0A511MZV5_DEIC1|nr:hypothetical protein [Deinococcus cellulosilyticus]GEM45727.1 hypothetical protein DC3_13620 [Deinococcus cellulosilyticus NBRC 106333 = KACC 11606]